MQNREQSSSSQAISLNKQALLRADRTGNGVRILESLAKNGINVFDYKNYPLPKRTTVLLGATNPIHNSYTYDHVLSRLNAVHWRDAHKALPEPTRRHVDLFDRLIDETNYQIVVLVTNETFASFPNGEVNFASREFAELAHKVANSTHERKAQMRERIHVVLGFSDIY